jgi:hypothetical protein
VPDKAIIFEQGKKPRLVSICRPGELPRRPLLSPGLAEKIAAKFAEEYGPQIRGLVEKSAEDWARVGAMRELTELLKELDRRSDSASDRKVLAMLRSLGEFVAQRVEAVSRA